MTTAITEYNQTEAALADLKSRYGNLVFDVKTTAGLAEAKKARAEIRGYRTSLEHLRQELKKPILDRGRLLDKEAERITTELAAMEDPIDQLIKAEEARKEAEKAAKAEADRKRLAGIQSRIDTMRAAPALAAGMTAAQVEAQLAEIEQTDTESGFDELKDFAGLVKDTTVDLLKEIVRSKRDAEAAAERMRLEREELDRQRLEQARIAEEQAARERAVAAAEAKTAAPANNPVAVPQAPVPQPVAIAVQSSPQIPSIPAVIAPMPARSAVVTIEEQHAEPLQAAEQAPTVQALRVAINSALDTMDRDALAEVLSYIEHLRPAARLAA